MNMCLFLLRSLCPVNFNIPIVQTSAKHIAKQRETHKLNLEQNNGVFQGILATPESYPSWNKGLIRPYKGNLVVNNPLLNLYCW